MTTTQGWINGGGLPVLGYGYVCRTHWALLEDCAVANNKWSLCIFPPELFPAPGLTVSSLQPIEGRSMTLSCNTWLPSDRATTQLRYSFFKDGHALQSGGSSPTFMISAIWKEDSGNYWCEAMTASHSVSKQSRRSYIDVESEYH